MSELPAWEDPRRVLARHGLAPKRRYSQNFLVSRSAVEQIAGALAPAPDEPVVELGPGLGTLTAALLRRGARVIALEADRDMIRVLQGELGHSPRLELHHGDARELDLSALCASALPALDASVQSADGAGSSRAPARIAVAGNLPYSVTGAIFRRLVAQHARIARAVLMVQREVRDRLLAAPGGKEYGALTVFTHGVFEVRSVCIVPAGAFHPPPKVDSAVVALVPRRVPVDVAQPAFVRAVRAAFDARRKTLRNALLRIHEPAAVDAALSAAGIDGQRRGETLSVREFAALAAALGR